MCNKQKPRYTLKATSTPLSTKKTEEGTAKIRLQQNEDDDLYDPYTDYHDGTLKEQAFEEDPWR